MKKLTEAYVGYIPVGSTEEEKCGVKLKVLHTKLDPSNFNKLEYVRYIANAFSYMISLQVYWSSRYNKDVAKVIISDTQLSEYIGCHVKHSSKILNQLQSIFSLEFKRLPEQGGAREITINERVIEFLKIYDDKSLHDFIVKYKIDKKDFKAIQQLYRYRAWGVKDTLLSDSQIESKKNFIKRHKNFFHRAISSNRTDHIRIGKVNGNREHLSSLNISQLERIQEEKKQGKLTWYWMIILIKLEQKISNILARIKRKSNQNNETETSETNCESNERPSVQHTRATAAAVKDPEDDSTPGDILDIMVSFNNMIVNQEIPEVKVMNKNHANAISYVLKFNTKEEIKQAINKVSKLYYDKKYKSKITFERFMMPDQIKWINKTIEEEDIEAPDYMSSYLAALDIETVANMNVVGMLEPLTIEECINTYNNVKQA